MTSSLSDKKKVYNKNDNDFIFYLKTKEGHTIKSWIELLKGYYKTGCFVITKDRITLDIMDDKKTNMINSVLLLENMVYKYKSKESEIRVGLNFEEMYKCLKSIKKKETLILEVLNKTPYVLKISGIKSEDQGKKNKKLQSEIVQYRKNVTIPNTNYRNSMLGTAKEFQQMIKELKNCKNINVEVKNGRIIFSNKTGDIKSEEYCFGDIDDERERSDEYKRSDDEGSDRDDDKGTDHRSDDRVKNYTQSLNNLQLVPLNKITGLSTNIKIFCGKNERDNLPFKFVMNIGTLGEITIYCKSQEQIEEERGEDEKGDDRDERSDREKMENEIDHEGTDRGNGGDDDGLVLDL